MAFAMIATATTAATTTTKSTTTTAAATRSALTRFADVDGASLDLTPVQGLDGLGSFRIRRHFDKSKTTGTTGVAVENDLHLFDVPSILAEHILQFGLGHVVRQIAYIKPRSHYFLLLRLTSLFSFLGRRRANRPGRTWCPHGCRTCNEPAPRRLPYTSAVRRSPFSTTPSPGISVGNKRLMN